jgi:hypothetical protein
MIPQQAKSSIPNRKGLTEKVPKNKMAQPRFILIIWFEMVDTSHKKQAFLIYSLLSDAKLPTKS